jgi:hypothetical protein
MVPFWARWGKSEGELLFAKRAFEDRYQIWKKMGVVPRNIDREIVEIMHHEPVLSEMIVAVTQTKEMEDYAKSKY